MGKSMYNFGNPGKEKARQQKQMDRAARRMIVKQQKANLKPGIATADPKPAEPEPVEKS